MTLKQRIEKLEQEVVELKLKVESALRQPTFVLVSQVTAPPAHLVPPYQPYQPLQGRGNTGDSPIPHYPITICSKDHPAELK